MTLEPLLWLRCSTGTQCATLACECIVARVGVRFYISPVLTDLNAGPALATILGDVSSLEAREGANPACKCIVQGHLAHKKHPPPWDPQRSLGIGLL